MSNTSKILLTSTKLTLILQRLACQIAENHPGCENTVLIGLQPRGIHLLDRLVAILEEEYALERIESGYLDTTFFRDDFRRTQKILAASPTDLNFQIEGKSVVLIDDVLFTGRSIRAALTAIDSYGRPSNIELLTLIDRRFSRHLPIQPDYLGVQIDALEGDKVRVKWGDRLADSMVYLENKDA